MNYDTKMYIRGLNNSIKYHLSNLKRNLFYIRSANRWTQSKLMQQGQSKFINLEDSKKEVHIIIKSLRETRLKIIELQISLL